ncbi:hypothetical protein [Candidatus Nitronereus thalassa]|uniref:Lipoprotein n=1 Tax=Candidatus Nitronereus thalassa TaxID=3020898 RepID=A0ABU3K748_9BACT|nr:hypothetical protein [Candidatus Nitronereus thalassa]MDT7042201.1 hypothetical protein [Candidatus Nitronereus thalassa]
MKKSVGVYMFVGMICLIAPGCNTSESEPSDESSSAEKGTALKNQEIVDTRHAPVEEDLNGYVKTVESQLDQLHVKHVNLVARVQQMKLQSEPRAAFNTTLDELIKKRKEVHIHIEALKTAKRKDWSALQLGMNHELEDLSRLYDTALAQFAG